MRFITLLTFALLAGTCFAQFSTTGGPVDTQGQCWALWADGETALMGFNENLYRTTNGGATWELLNNGIPEGVDPRTIEYTNGLFVVGTNNNFRLYMSEDGGDSWNASAANPLLIPTASAVAGGHHFMGGTLNEPSQVDPSNGGLIPTGASGTLTHALNHVGENEVWQAAGSVSSAQTRYSTDAGATWTALAEEPQVDIGGGLIWSAIPQDFVRCADRIIAGTSLVGFPIIYSDNNGVSWTPGDLPSTTWSDYGKRFAKVSNDHLLTTNLEGIWKSTNQGETWTLIQAIEHVRTMVLFNGDHLLVGTDDGVCEFANYGEGELVAKHGAAGGASSLVAYQDQVWTFAGGALQAYDSDAGAWNAVQSTTTSGEALPDGPLFMAGDSVFIVGDQLAAAHADELSFTLRSAQTFGFDVTTTVADFGTVKFVGTRDGWSTGDIYRSTDGGLTFEVASFNNTVAYGYGGLNGNYAEAFWQIGSTLWVDMNAGYAVSEDDGVTWTFYGTTWDDSHLMPLNGVMYRFNIDSFDGSGGTLSSSTENGVSWTDMPLDGIPGNGSAYGVFVAGGQLYTHHHEDGSQGLYSWNGSSWTFEPGTDGAPSADMQALVLAGGVLYGAWNQSGVWAAGQVDMSIEDFNSAQLLYPNPARDYVNVGAGNTVMSVTDLRGTALPIQLLSGGRLDVSDLLAGIYLVHTKQAGTSMTERLVVVD